MSVVPSLVPAPRSTPDDASHSAAAPTRRYDSQELFGTRNVILIRHAEQEYVLRVTRNGKLILTK
jgi:hemin uptake protein HemP